MNGVNCIRDKQGNIISFDEWLNMRCGNEYIKRYNTYSHEDKEYWNNWGDRMKRDFKEMDTKDDNFMNDWMDYVENVYDCIEIN